MKKIIIYGLFVLLGCSSFSHRKWDSVDSFGSAGSADIESPVVLSVIETGSVNGSPIDSGVTRSMVREIRIINSGTAGGTGIAGETQLVETGGGAGAGAGGAGAGGAGGAGGVPVVIENTGGTGSELAPCSDGEARCGDVCVDLSNDSQHCGHCNAACFSSQECVHAQCNFIDAGVAIGGAFSTGGSLATPATGGMMVGTGGVGNIGGSVGLTGGTDGCGVTSVFDLSGTTSNIQVPSSPIMDFGTQFTLEAWVYFRDLNVSPGFSFLFTKGVFATEDKTWQLENDGTFLSWFYVPGHPESGVRSSVLFSVLNWHHVAISYASGTYRIFLDGALSGSTVLDAAYDISDSNGILRIGSDLGSVSGINGYISDLRLSSTAKYTADFVPVTTIPVESDTVALWRIDEGSGTFVADSGPHALNGIVVGDTQWATVNARCGADGSKNSSATSLVAGINETSTPETDNSIANCKIGSEGCACYGNETCDNGLTCNSNVCGMCGVKWVLLSKDTAFGAAGSPESSGFYEDWSGVSLARFHNDVGYAGNSLYFPYESPSCSALETCNLQGNGWSPTEAALECLSIGMRMCSVDELRAEFDTCGLRVCLIGYAALNIDNGWATEDAGYETIIPGCRFLSYPGGTGTLKDDPTLSQFVMDSGYDYWGSYSPPNSGAWCCPVTN